MRTDRLNPGIVVCPFTTSHQSHSGVVPAPPPQHAVTLSEPGRADHAMVALIGLNGISGAFWRLLHISEALASSGIEGIHSTIESVLLEQAGSPQDAHTAQVHHHSNALCSCVPVCLEQGRGSVDLDMILGLHRDLLVGDPHYTDVPGTLRNVVVWIAGNRSGIENSTYNPPGPEHVRKCLMDTISYMNSSSRLTQGIFVRLAVAHAHFEAVHPFRDGNGRVGRLLIPLMLAGEGYPPLGLSTWFLLHRKQYYSCLMAAQQQLDYEPLAYLIMEGVIETERHTSAMSRLLDELQRQWRSGMAPRAGSAADRALDFILHRPVFSITVLARDLGVTFKAASEGVSSLMQHKIIEEITGHSRNKIYRCQAALDVFAR